MLPPKPLVFPPSSSNNQHPSFVGFLIILILILLSSTVAEAECNPDDKDSLLSLATKFPNLNWSATIDCCSWDGISCDHEGYRVAGLSIPKRGLHGTLPAGLFSSLNNLHTLDLSYNRLSGTFPSTLPTTLQVLNISSNLFTGTIPPSLCSTSPALVILDLSLNSLTGNIPRGFGACSSLEVLSLGFNNLTGQIPTDINGALSLQQLLLPGNSLMGEIDQSITNLTNLKRLVLFGNMLSGPIPRNIGKLSLLEKLELHINRLNGTLPLSLMNCTKLQLLNLWFNSLGGRLSSFDFSNFSQLTIVDLSNNQFSGVLPKSLFSCKSLTAIRMAVNRLEGEISPEILKLPSLSFLSLAYNTFKNISLALDILSNHKNLTILLLTGSFFNETLPAAGISGFQNLKMMALSNCNFFGQLPIWLMSLVNLQALDLSHNNIDGTIPGWLQTLPNLFTLDLSYNYLSGGFPLALTRLPALASQQVKNKNFELPVFVRPQNVSLQYNQLAAVPPVLKLARNNLSGDIPVEIGEMQSIHTLDLSHNYFSGTIPSSISNLTNLEKLDLSHNLLSGEIPSSLKSLNFLSLFNVANNNLQGSIPTGGQFDTFSDQSYEGNLGLCGPPLQKSCSNRSEASSSPLSGHKKGLDTELVVGPILGFCFGFGIILTCQIFCVLAKRRILPRWIHTYFIWA